MTLANNFNAQLIEAARNARWEVEKRMMRHYGIGKHDRYSGEHGTARKDVAGLSHIYSYDNAAIRDAIVRDFREAKKLNGWADLEISANDDPKGSRWPHGIRLEVTAPLGTPLTALHATLAQYFQTVGEKYPERAGIPWDEYIKTYRTGDDMRWKGGADSQIDNFAFLKKIYRGAELYVVGDHMSKSIVLPVVQMEMPRCGTLVTIRDNFHDICVSVEAPFRIKDTRNFHEQFNLGDKGGCFEGFPQEHIHDGFNKDSSKFSFTVGSFADLLPMLTEIHNQDYRSEALIARPKPVAKFRKR